MEGFFTISLSGETPILATAIHDGHLLSDDLLQLSALNESERLREEDPYTGIWTEISDNRVIVHHSRFEFDLNRPPEKAIYIEPADAWGLTVWNEKPSTLRIGKMMENYMEFYHRMHETLAFLTEKFDHIVVLDLHSYNHRRNGPGAAPDDPELNPEVNLGTGTMNRENWANVVDRFVEDLRTHDFMGRHLDVRENIKFKGGYFPKWIHENFPASVCCISVEFKKFFMDEWSGVPDHTKIRAIKDLLGTSLPGIREELAKKAR